MNKILGIDYGNKRIGIAISDALHILARPYKVIQVESKKKSRMDILEICKKENINTLVFGLPLNMDGSKGFQAEEVEKFAKAFDGYEIIFLDERLTSKMAEENMKLMGMNRKKIKTMSDAYAAQLILQNYLDGM